MLGLGTLSSWQLVRCVAWLNGAKVVHPEKEMTRDHMEVPAEPMRARGGARSSRRRTVDTLMVDEREEEARQAADEEEKETDRQIREQMLTALGQLNQRLEKLEGQQSAASSAAGGFVPVDYSPSGREGA